jgi:hypothetical protein
MRMMIKNGLFLDDPVLTLLEKQGFYHCSFFLSVTSKVPQEGHSRYVKFRCAAIKDLALYIGKNCKKGDYITIANMVPTNNDYVDHRGEHIRQISWVVWEIGDVVFCTDPDDCEQIKREERRRARFES